MPTVKPISELQRNMAAITQECQETRSPIYLTKNGTATLVVMDADAFDEQMSVHRQCTIEKRACSVQSCEAAKTSWPAHAIA